MNKLVGTIFVIFLLCGFTGAEPIPSDSSSSITYFQMTQKNRAWQGVATDGRYIYVISDRDESFKLENIISVFSMDGNLISEKRNAYTGVNSLNQFMSFGDDKIINGSLYVTVYDHNSRLGVEPFTSKVVKYNLPDLTINNEYDIGSGVAEGISLHGNDYWIAYHDQQVINKFDSNFALVQTYPLSQNRSEFGGYQSIFWVGNKAFLNFHGPNTQGLNYSPGLDEYSFDGVNFTFVKRFTPPTYGSGQGVDFYNGKYYWADRPDNRIVITKSLEPGKIVPVIGVFGEQKQYKPTLLNGWTVFDTVNDRSLKVWKNSDGMVHMEGMVKGGAIGNDSNVIQLPPEYRPKFSKNIPIVSNKQFGYIAIVGDMFSKETGGNVYVMVGDPAWVSFDGVSFLADTDQ